MTLIEEVDFHKVFAAYLEKHWGPRCSDFSIGCIVCHMWAVHDEIKAAEDWDHIDLTEKAG